MWERRMHDDIVLVPARRLIAARHGMRATLWGREPFALRAGEAEHRKFGQSTVTSYVVAMRCAAPLRWRAGFAVQMEGPGCSHLQAM